MSRNACASWRPLRSYRASLFWLPVAQRAWKCNGLEGARLAGEQTAQLCPHVSLRKRTGRWLDVNELLDGAAKPVAGAVFSTVPDFGEYHVLSEFDTDRHTHRDLDGADETNAGSGHVDDLDGQGR